jgi:hypothetical protein
MPGGPAPPQDFAEEGEKRRGARMERRGRGGGQTSVERGEGEERSREMVATFPFPEEDSRAGGGCGVWDLEDVWGGARFDPEELSP